MTEREHIFTHIREALAAPPMAPHDTGGAPAAATDTSSFSRVLPATGTTFEEHAALFAKNSAELRTDFRQVKDLTELTAELKKIAAAEGWTRVASHEGSLTNAACQALGLPVLRTDAAYDKVDLEKVPVGLSECDALVAQTGSVVVTSRSSGGRALSCLPPHHVVLARREQMVPGLPEAFALLRRNYGAGFPSMISFITGPSRTGDIERILVLGAHGPKKLTVFCV